MSKSLRGTPSGLDGSKVIRQLDLTVRVAVSASSRMLKSFLNVRQAGQR
jgi:hypothetical protein